MVKKWLQFYVNPILCKSWISPVEKGCGKVCGKCGKLLVINRYSGCLQVPDRLNHKLADSFSTANGLHQTPSPKKRASVPAFPKKVGSFGKTIHNNKPPPEEPPKNL